MPTGEQVKIGLESISEQIGKESKVHIDLSLDCIITTEDKIHIWQNKNIKIIKEIENRKFRVAPIGIFITMLIAILTSTFNDKFLKADTWEAIFIICAVGSFIWGMKPLVLYIKALFKKQAKTKDTYEIIEEMIDDLKRKSRTLPASEETSD